MHVNKSYVLTIHEKFNVTFILCSLLQMSLAVMSTVTAI